MTQSTRKFSGKNYKVHLSFFSHSDAAKTAKAQRKKGNLARVVESGNKFVVYVR